MLQFEFSLLKELQRQQSRAQFCDTVLQAQGVSVPVHSCVLSAFSPQLCGALSAMPAPPAGQRRLIELQAVEALTLLRLVGLLYSGQLDEEGEELLSAAQKLGINLPLQHREERWTNGGDESEAVHNGVEREKTYRKCLRETSPDNLYIEIQTGMKGECGRVHEKVSDSGTQTESARKTERETQTDDDIAGLHDLLYTDPGQLYPEQTSHQGTVQPAVWESVREHFAHPLSVAHSIAMTTAGDVTAPTNNVLTSGAAVDSSVGEHSSVPLSRIYLYSSEQQNSHPFLSMLEVEPPANQLAIRGVRNGLECGTEGFEQFQGNIPGFINNFLNPTHSQGPEQRRQGRRRASGRARRQGQDGRMRRARAGHRSQETKGGEKGKQKQTKGLIERCGSSVRLAWRGRGGGRIGRKTGARERGRQPVRRRKLRETAVNVVEERGQVTPRHSARQRGRRGRRRGPTRAAENQDMVPPVRRQRGRPRIRPLPVPARPPNFYKPALSSHDLSASKGISTTPAPQADPTEPIDRLLDDFMKGFHLPLPVTMETQCQQKVFLDTTASSLPHELVPTTNPSVHHIPEPVNSIMSPVVESSDLTVPQQQSDGELCDVLDHFLRSFEQHLGECVLEEGTGSSEQSETVKTFKHVDGVQIREVDHRLTCSSGQWITDEPTPSEPLQANYQHTHPVNTVSLPLNTHTPQTPDPQAFNSQTCPVSQRPTAPPSQNRLQIPNDLRKHTWDGKMKMLESMKEEECKSQIITRSQVRRMKLDESVKRGPESLLMTDDRQTGVDWFQPYGKRAKRMERTEAVRSGSFLLQKRKRSEPRFKDGAHQKCSRHTAAVGLRGDQLEVCVLTNKYKHIHPQPMKNTSIEAQPISGVSEKEAMPRKRKCSVNGYTGRRRVGNPLGRRKTSHDNQSVSEDQSIMDGVYSETEPSAFEKIRRFLKIHVERDKEREEVHGINVKEDTVLSIEETEASEKQDMNGGVAERQATPSLQATPLCPGWIVLPRDREGMKIDKECTFNTEHTSPLNTDLHKCTPDLPKQNPQLSVLELPLELVQSTPDTYQNSPVMSQNTPNVPRTSKDLTFRMTDLTLRAGETGQVVSPKKQKLKSCTLSQQKELLPSCSPLRNMQGAAGTVDEDGEEEEVDVMDISSPAQLSLAITPVCCGVELSTEEKDEEEEEEIDVIGVKSD